MGRLVLGIEYDGSGFCGWQWQPGKRSVQGELESALSYVASRPVQVTCAGRTDAGVHAMEQIVHFDSEADRNLDSWLLGGNSHLPDDVRILWAKPAVADFHARYSALARLYRYVILNRSVNSALERKKKTWFYRPLDELAMHEAGQYLIGNHDFSSFMAKGCQSVSPYRHVHFISVNREDDTVTIDICANAFLHHMVRNIVGVLLAIGTGKQPKTWPIELLESKDRSLGGVTAPPDGLYLLAVFYPKHFGLIKHPLFDNLPDDVIRYN